MTVLFETDWPIDFSVKNAIYKAPLPNYSQPLSFSTWLYKATHVFDMPGLMVASLVFDPDGKLYFVVDDKLYMMLPNSTKSYKELAVKGWSAFKFLFFNPEGILYGVENGKLRKRSPPTAPDDDWLATSTLIGTAGWSDFQFLFFMSSGELYGVYQDKFYKGSPPTQSIDAHTWLASSTLIGSSGWSQFKFLMSPLRAV